MTGVLSDNVDGGELTLVSLDGAPSQHSSAVGTKLLDSLAYDERHAHAVEALLGDVFVVSTAGEALAAANADGNANRYITKDGVVAWPGGKVTYGHRSGGADGVLARKKRMSELEAELPRAQADIDSAQGEVAQAQERLQVAQADDFELSQSIAQLSGERDSLREEAGRLEASITGLMQEREEIEQRRKKVAEDTKAKRALLVELEEERSKLEGKKAEHAEAIASLREKRDKLYEEETLASRRIQQLQVELATVRERNRHLLQSCDQASRDISKLQESLEVSRETERNLEILRLRVQPLYDCFTELRSYVTEKAEMLRDRAQLEQAGQGDLKNTIEEARKAVATQQTELDGASEGLIQARIEKSKLEVRVEQAIKAITEENGVLLDIALEIPAPQNRQEAEAQRDKLAKKIKNLGSVNPVAVEEYRKLKDRRDFINIQVDDLRGAAKALERIVAAIDRKMRNRFMETFNQVNANYEEIFSMLFPGGQGHLELTDPDNPEETGVEVHAQPRGKTVRKQSLLSGGEQSLASLALMFAVYRVRNTPFYILDEVEAALDDTNLRRLLAFLDSIRDTTQIIMISHQRRTMEMADLLYGVSMRSDGVSKLVSQKLDQAIRMADANISYRDVESFTAAQ